MLKEEWQRIPPQTVDDVVKKWESTPVSITICNCYLYKMFHNYKGWLTLFALNATSEDVYSIREDLGLTRKPEKYNMHITLLEKQ